MKFHTLYAIILSKKIKKEVLYYEDKEEIEKSSKADFNKKHTQKNIYHTTYTHHNPCFVFGHFGNLNKYSF